MTERTYVCTGLVNFAIPGLRVAPGSLKRTSVPCDPALLQECCDGLDNMVAQIIPGNLLA